MKESEEYPETEPLKDAKESENSRQEHTSSPRAVLEIPVLGSDSDHSSNSISVPTTASGSCHGDCFLNEKSEESLSGENHGSSQWRNFFDSIKKRSVRRLSLSRNPLLFGHGISRKNMQKKLGRIRSSEAAIDCGDSTVVPKPSWRNFAYGELQAATDDFSPDKLIGKGGHAEVYKGCLSDGQVVAVKRIIKKEKNEEDRASDFLSELGIIAHINHQNAAKLIGFSIDGGFYLVLQYSPHGSLASVLHGSTENLEWKIRFKVAIGVAEGLQYLHCECQRRIIHRDIKASNILFSDDYEPQISDFGLAKWLPDNWVHHVVSPIEGTFGYMAPEYFMHGIVDEKTDVFAFGVLLLELITGRHAVDSCRQSLVMWAKPMLEKNNVKELADPRLEDTYDTAEMQRVVLTASTCLHHLPNMRPNMTRVVELLRGEKGEAEIKQQRFMGGRAVILDACDLEDYSCTTYLKDLNRHMELVME